MTRRSAARHSSKPPPRAMPLIATAVGIGRSSRSENSRSVDWIDSSNCASGRLKSAVNSVMSAPTINIGLALVISRARTSARSLIVSSA
ncbi:hypothetical protein D3C85_1693480 [compost metagenome]